MNLCNRRTTTKVCLLWVSYNILQYSCCVSIVSFLTSGCNKHIFFSFFFNVLSNENRVNEAKQALDQCKRLCLRSECVVVPRFPSGSQFFKHKSSPHSWIHVTNDLINGFSINEEKRKNEKKKFYRKC